MKKIIAVVLMVLLSITGCSGKYKNTSIQNMPNLANTHLGAAILKEPQREPKKNIYEDSGIYSSDVYAPFTKVMDVYGIKFVAKESVADEFMLKVAQTMKEMFVIHDDTDKKTQELILQNLHKYSALLPIVESEEDMNGAVVSKMMKENSICDIIMTSSQTPTMEVVEHILHAVTDIGFSYAMPEKWGFGETSVIGKDMTEAIKSKFYDISSYTYEDSELKNRITIQEYAYWLITSAWDLQKNYGLGENEWKLDTSNQLKSQFPKGYALFEETVATTMTVPNSDTLDSFKGETSTLKIAGNKNYGLYVTPSDIKRDVTLVNKKYKGHYDKYIEYMAPNGKPIVLIAQDQVTDEQLLKAYNILSFYLTSHKEYDMNLVANTMANNKAMLIMPNGADGDKELDEAIFSGQPVYQMEAPVTGDKWYMENDYTHRDASYEEILHLVHDYGIGTSSQKGALPKLQKIIYDATMNALPKDKKDWGTGGLWGYNSKDWLVELSKEGSLEQEYLVGVFDSYYGLWEAYTESKGGMWGIYCAKTRAEIKEKDPVGYKTLELFLPKNFTYMDRISPNFSGTFSMTRDPKAPYTFKSQHIMNARLTGSNDSNIDANAVDNILIGNSGNNTINGKDGTDIVQLSGASSEYNISSDSSDITITDTQNRDGKDTLINIEVLRFTDKDVLVSEIKK